MAANTFGKLFAITTFGESHGKAIGVVIDGCPSGLELCEDDIQQELILRAPGMSAFTSPRKEPDRAEILSGVFEGKTTGAPICIMIPNTNHASSAYEPIKDLLRPGHANYTYQEKYGVFDYRGGGRASARETACRVAAGAVAKKVLKHCGISVAAYIKQIGPVVADVRVQDHSLLQKATYSDPVYCPDAVASRAIQALLSEASGDSFGGVVECIAFGMPVGLGDPVYQKLEANLAAAMMSIPASKGFEIGSGFCAAFMKGSEHNDLFTAEQGCITTKTNHAGGALGGISTGMPLITRVAFKPTSSIAIEQETLNFEGKIQPLVLPSGSRHDPALCIRAVPVVEAMCALVLVDAMLMNRCVRL